MARTAILSQLLLDARRCFYDPGRGGSLPSKSGYNPVIVYCIGYAPIRLTEALAQAQSEEDVTDAYIKALGLKS